MPFQISLNTHKTVLWLSNFRGLSSGKNVTLHIKIVRGTPLINIYLTHTCQKKQIKPTLRFLHASCLVNNRKVEPIIYQFPTTIESTNTHSLSKFTHTHTLNTLRIIITSICRKTRHSWEIKKIYKYVNIWTVKKKKTKIKSLVFSINFYPPFCILYNWFILLFI